MTVDDALTAARRAFTALANGTVVQPPRITMPIAPHDAAHLSMPCYLHDDSGEVLCMKAVTIYPGNGAKHGLPTTLGFLTLYNPETGEPLAFIDAEHLTATRTAAGSALATKLLAREDSKVLGILGVGRQALAHAKALAGLFDFTRIQVYSPSSSDTKAFCGRLTGAGPDVVACPSPHSALADADIVCFATSSSTPVIDADALKPGTHINAIGSYRPEMAEFPPAAVAGMRVVVDDLGAAQRGAGELIQAEAAGLWDWSRVAGDLGSLLLGHCTGRISPDDITLFKSVGLAVQDATAAHTVYENHIAKSKTPSA